MDNDILGQLKEQDETAYFLNIIRDQDIPAMVSDLAILDEEGKKSLHALIERAEKNRLLLHRVKLDDLSALFLAFQRITLMTYRHALHNTWLRMAKEHLADIEKIFAHGDLEKEAYEKEVTQLKGKIKDVEETMISQQQTIEIMVNSMAPNIEKAAQNSEKTAQDVAEIKPRVKGLLAQQNSDKMKDKHSITQAEAVDILKNSNNQITERTLRNWINGKGTPKNFPAWPTDAVTFGQFAVTLDYKQKTKNALTQRRSRQ